MSELQPIGRADNIHQIVSTGQLKEFLQSEKIHPNWQDKSTGRNLLHLAAASNRVDTIEFLISECRVNVNAQDNEGNTALHLAVLNNHLEATGTILTHKPDDALCNKDQSPPLHIAIKQGAQGVKVVSEFVKHPTVNLLVKGHYGFSTIHAIAECNNLEALKLIDSQSPIMMDNSIVSDFTVNDKEGFTPIHLAACAGSHDVLAFMLLKSSDPKLCVSSISTDSKTPFHYAVEYGNVECVKVLLEYGADPMAVNSPYHPPPIHSACIHNHLNIVKLMVDELGKDILQSRNLEGGNILHSSVASISCQDLLSYGVENGVHINDTDSNGATPLCTAIQCGSVYTVEEVLRLGGDPLIKDQMGFTALHRAVLSERIEVFKKIVSCDAACCMASTADGEGNYPIHHALKLGLHEMVVALLDITSEVFHDRHRNNYLHLAASSCQEQTVSYLLGRPFGQSMLNKANSSGCTPLHCAALRSNTAVIKNLLNHGAVIHRDKKGQTPFMCACSTGNLDAVQLLYKKRQYLRDWTDHNGSTALHLAVDSKSADVVMFCLDTGMPITLNYDKLSFFDKVLNFNSQKLAKAVLSHKRWEECINVYSPSKPHPLLRILDQMPNVYKIILDQCHTKSNLSPTHPDYSEDFNFKCLDLTIVDDQPVEQNQSIALSEPLELSEFSDHSQFQHENILARRQIRIRRASKVHLFTIVQKFLEQRHDTYMQHPVTLEFIRLKWVSYGSYFHTVATAVPFLAALFFSIFILLIPLPPQDINLFPENDNKCDIKTEMMSAGSVTMLYITLIIAFLQLLMSSLRAYIEGPGLLIEFKILCTRIVPDIMASLCIVIFLLSILAAGLDRALWNSAALGLLFAWFAVGFSAQFLHFFNIGVYITMVVSTMKLVAIVALSLSTFLVGFAFAFYILLGSVAELQYETIGLSLFTTLHSLIATTDFIGIVDVFQAGGLRFSVLVFLLLVLLIFMLPIVFINLLIGLAIGDINQNQREAVFGSQSFEVHVLSVVYQRVIPHYFAQNLSMKYHKYYPNKNKLSNFLTKIFHNSLSNYEAPNTDLKDTIIEKKFSEHNKLLNQLYSQLEQKIDRLSSESPQFDKMKQLEEVVDAKIRRLESLLHTAK